MKYLLSFFLFAFRQESTDMSDFQFYRRIELRNVRNLKCCGDYSCQSLLSRVKRAQVGHDSCSRFCTLRTRGEGMATEMRRKRLGSEGWG